MNRQQTSKERTYAVHDAVRLVMSLPNPDDVVRRYVADALLAEIDRLHEALLRQTKLNTEMFEAGRADALRAVPSKEKVYADALDWICDVEFNGATVADAALEMQRRAGRALAEADRLTESAPKLCGRRTRNPDGFCSEVMVPYAGCPVHDVATPGEIDGYGPLTDCDMDEDETR
jgi:hypothetical protein